ncbi:MAG: hypothetical protein ACXV3F_05380 [Frankiaceae bacterium]
MQRLNVGWVLWAIMRKPLGGQVMCLFDALDDLNEVVHTESAIIEGDNHPAEYGVDLCPVHTLKPGELFFYAANELRVLGQVRALNLNVSVADSGPTPSLATTGRRRQPLGNPGN